MVPNKKVQMNLISADRTSKVKILTKLPLLITTVPKNDVGGGGGGATVFISNMMGRQFEALVLFN